MKYIMFNIDHNKVFDQRIPIIFPDLMNHEDIANLISPQIKFLLGHYTIISAGFYDPKTQECFGESISLKVKSLGEIDAAIIKNMDEELGVVK